MKKIIAMLLCIAMVAALSVSAFALTKTDEDHLKEYKEAVADNLMEAEKWDSYAAILTAAEKIAYDREMALWEGHVAGKDADPDVWNLYVMSVNADAEKALLDLAKSDPVAAKYVKDNIDSRIFDGDRYVDGTFNRNTFDGFIKTYKDNAKQDRKDADHWQVYVDYYQELVDEAAAKKAAAEAAEKAAAERAELVAKLTKGIDQSTAAGKLLAQATVNKYDFENNMKAAKKSAEAAQKTIDTAKKAAFTTAQALVLDAQTVAYNKMAAEITTAVNEYVAGVYEAIADFYADLG